MQSAVGSVATSVPQIEDYVPLNCTFGLVRFCVGFKRSLSCSSSPFTLSALVSDEIQDLPGPLGDAIESHIGELASLPGSVRSLSTGVMGCLIAGALSIMLLLLLSCSVAYACPASISRMVQKVSARKQMLFHLGVGMVCCSPYVALVAVQHNVIRALGKLPAWVQAEAGEVFGVSIGTMASVLVFAALVAVLVGWSRVQRDSEASVNRPLAYALSRVTGTRRAAA